MKVVVIPKKVFDAMWRLSERYLNNTGSEGEFVACITPADKPVSKIQKDWRIVYHGVREGR